MTEATRLETIEIKLAHLESSLQELGQTVMRQQRDIEVLSARNQALQNQVQALASDTDDGAEFEKPPHY